MERSESSSNEGMEGERGSSMLFLGFVSISLKYRGTFYSGKATLWL